LYDKVSYHYRPGLPPVLNDVTLDIHSGEKIGICGRTGAGKTSLIYPLFRYFVCNIFYFIFVKE
jgi:ABC-type multidrug transport system fused ATPase/permease subunit